jgi:hypothetical protein
LSCCTAEARQGDDCDPTDLVLKRSVYDRGRSLPVELNGTTRQFGYGVSWERSRTVLAGSGGSTITAITNPSPLLDTRTGDIMVCCKEICGGLVHHLAHPWHGRCLILRSSMQSDGSLWDTPPLDITSSVGDFVAGPATGIQLQCGRLVVPGYSSQGARVIFSDDGGARWVAGAPVRNPDCNECTVVERGDGTLLLNMRHDPAGRGGCPKAVGCRYVALSCDRGESWQEERDEEVLPDCGCQGALLRVPTATPTPATTSAVRAFDGSVLLFANAPHPERSLARREDITVRVSNSDGMTWSRGRCVQHGPGAYTALAALHGEPGERILYGMLYETGDSSAYERLRFARFNLAWLMEHDVDDNPPPSHLNGIYVR